MWRPLAGNNPELRQKIAQTFFGAPKAEDQQQNVTAPRAAQRRVATPKVVKPRNGSRMGPMGPMGPGRIQAAQIAQQRSRSIPPPGDLAGSS